MGERQLTGTSSRAKLYKVATLTTSDRAFSPLWRPHLSTGCIAGRHGGSVLSNAAVDAS